MSIFQDRSLKSDYFKVEFSKCRLYQIACSFARHTSNMKCCYDTESTKKRGREQNQIACGSSNVPTGKSAVTAPKVIKIPDGGQAQCKGQNENSKRVKRGKTAIMQ